MVNFFVSALTLVAASQMVTGAPSDYEARSSHLGDFSFESWADSIAKNPPRLSFVTRGYGTHGGPSKRSTVRCNTIPNTDASVPDAVWCINFLAARPTQKCSVAAGGSIAFCRHGLAQIVGVNGKPASGGPTSSNCGDVARAAGRIMDVCTRGNTVQGENTAYGNGFLGVNIRRT